MKLEQLNVKDYQELKIGGRIDQVGGAGLPRLTGKSQAGGISVVIICIIFCFWTVIVIIA